VAALPEPFAARIAQIAADRQSGASEILAAVIALLAEALALTDGPAGTLAEAARAVCRAQPAMASVWNAALQALAAEASPERFARFARRVARAPEALARFAAECFALDDPRTPLRLVTLSFSRSVVTAMTALAASRQVRVSCCEGRPALEGRRLAALLAGEGIPITFYGDAAIGHALAAADAVLVGVDAVSPEWFLNKSGTRMLAAAAAQQGVPFHVAATRDKFVSHPVAARLVVGEAAAAEIWDTPPAGVLVRNPYFEQTPLDLVTSLITDVGVLGAGMVPDVCNESQDAAMLRAVAELTR
jgi:translation initiation factor 2B subunit (eIF-2B alpha/beta/delta family)